jgi:uncharacterized protein (TIGR00369 family)
LNYQPQDPSFEARVRAIFARQTFMTTLGATLVAVEPGAVTIDLPFRPDLLQQHGFLHAAALTAVVDSACGFAALTLMPPEAAVLTIEFKVNFLAPAAGTYFRAIGRVVRAGRNICVSSGEVLSLGNGEAQGKEPVIALMQATVMTVRGSGLAD